MRKSSYNDFLFPSCYWKPGDAKDIASYLVIKNDHLVWRIFCNAIRNNYEYDINYIFDFILQINNIDDFKDILHELWCDLKFENSSNLLIIQLKNILCKKDELNYYDLRFINIIYDLTKKERLNDSNIKTESRMKKEQEIFNLIANIVKVKKIVELEKDINDLKITIQGKFIMFFLFSVFTTYFLVLSAPFLNDLYEGIKSFPIEKMIILNLFILFSVNILKKRN